jgi:hypothetical protein
MSGKQRVGGPSAGLAVMAPRPAAAYLASVTFAVARSPAPLIRAR